MRYDKEIYEEEIKNILLYIYIFFLSLGIYSNIIQIQYRPKMNIW